MRLHKTLRTLITVVLAAMLLVSGAAAGSRNPLITPQEITDYTPTHDRMLNILLLGIDYGMEGYWGSGYKQPIDACHTDADLVVSINLDKHRIDLVSLPRDTVTYVPGVQGIYKLNAAMNCAGNVYDGLKKTKEAAQWLLGDIQIDYFFAVDMQTMIALGNAIGGAQIDSEMKYQGSSGKWYHKGLQHMNGTGIMDYVRARTNATVNYTDIGRTNRQREAMIAVYRKLREDPAALLALLETAMAQHQHFLTDISAEQLAELASLLPSILSVDADSIGSHVLDGSYRGILVWNFTFTNQQHRLNVLKTVYGIDAEPLPYVSTDYAQWLMDTGFSTVQYISVARELMASVTDTALAAQSDAQRQTYEAFTQAYEAAIAAFETAADSLNGSDRRAMESARQALRDAGDAYAEAIGHESKLLWSRYRDEWFNDPYINEFQLDWR